MSPGSRQNFFLRRLKDFCTPPGSVVDLLRVDDGPAHIHVQLLPRLAHALGERERRNEVEHAVDDQRDPGQQHDRVEFAEQDHAPERDRDDGQRRQHPPAAELCPRAVNAVLQRDHAVDDQKHAKNDGQQPLDDLRPQQAEHAAHQQHDARHQRVRPEQPPRGQIAHHRRNAGGQQQNARHIADNVRRRLRRQNKQQPDQNRAERDDQTAPLQALEITPDGSHKKASFHSL